MNTLLSTTQQEQDRIFDELFGFFAGRPKNKAMTPNNVREYIKNRDLAIEEVARADEAKAFGSCKKCYGKGYSTQIVNEVGAEDFGGEGYETGPHTVMNFCSCERGKQLERLLTTSPSQ